MADVRVIVLKQLEEVFAEEGVVLPRLSDELVLLASGLDSLGFAVLVAKLEDEFGSDPFSSAEESYYPETLGEFISVYEREFLGR